MPSPVSGRLRLAGGAADPGGSLASLERSLRRAELHSLEWPESEGLSPAHREILELAIRHGLDSHGLGLVLGLGLGQSTRSTDVPLGSVGSQGFGALADAWRELERSLAAVAVAKASTEHCAQLAELTFGWSGRLNATMRAPLTEHVDGCTRCQHYLHTVIGTPAAPTILPFVAAPRALREIVLSELRDPELALRLGVDHSLIAARIRDYAPDGFPVVTDSSSVRRRGGRRAASKHGPSRTPTSVLTPVPAPAPAPAPASVPSRTSAPAPEEPPPTVMEPEDALPRRVPGTSRPRIGAQSQHTETRSGTRQNAGADSSVFRTPGSWAARVLPPDTEAEWRPTPGRSSSSPHSTSADDETREPFISTPSGRFAFRTPAEPGGVGLHRQPPHARSAYTDGMAGVNAITHTAPRTRAWSGSGSGSGSDTGTGTGTGTGSDGTGPDRMTGTGRLPRFAAPEPEAPRGPDGKPRPAQHRSRPMRQAVLSAVTLGAVGAAAAATAALLGFASDGHSSQLIDSMPSKDPGSGPNGGGLTVSVSTPPVPLASSSVHSSGPQGPGKSVGTGVGTGGTAHGSSGAAPGSSSSSGSVSDSGSVPGANAADFHVSVNQRAADPNSVTIVLRNSGTAPIAWQAAARDTWIVLSQSSGTLGGGQSQAIIATATGAAPAGPWMSTVTFAPGGAVVTLHGDYANPSSGPASPPASGGSSGSTPGIPSAGSTPTPPPTPTHTPSASGSGIGPSAARPTHTVPGGGEGGGSSTSTSTNTSTSPSSQNSTTSTAGSAAPAAPSPRHAASRR